MVLHVLANGGQITANINARAFQHRTRAKTCQVHDLRRVDRPCRQDHLASRAHVMRLPPPLIGHAGHTSLSISQPGDMRPLHQFNIRPLQRRFQIRAGG